MRGTIEEIGTAMENTPAFLQRADATAIARAADSTPSRIRKNATAFVLAVIAAIALVAAALVYAATPVQASAETESMTGEMDTQAQGELARFAETAAPTENQEGVVQGPTAADDCIVVIKYLEYAPYEDPDAVIDEGGRRVLGTRVLTGLHEGDVLNAWNYVVDIPGHFFFDGWPLNMTVTTDPAQNVFDLIYVKLWDSEYTVNYYLMTGADLAADTWSEALAPDDVDFIKMGSETFTDQRFDALIEGDAYEYKLDGMYVVDTYPAEIRLGTDPDNNVINVLYVPELNTLPDEVEVPDGVVVPDPDPDAPNPPEDGTVDYDSLITTLPDDVVVEDFVGTDVDNGNMDVTDEMLSTPVNKQEAERMIDAYNTGLRTGDLAQTGDNSNVLAWVLGGIAVVAAVGAIIAFAFRNRKKEEPSQ